MKFVDKSTKLFLRGCFFGVRKLLVYLVQGFLRFGNSLGDGSKTGVGFDSFLIKPTVNFLESIVDFLKAIVDFLAEIL